jgi:hypothetical protein
MTVHHDESLSALSYLNAAKVDSPAGFLSELDVVTAQGEQLGSIAGVVIEAAAGRARYFDIEAPGLLRRRHYLVEAEQLGQVDPERKVLRLLAGEVKEVADLDPATLRPFSDDDLIAALFRPRAA